MLQKWAICKLDCIEQGFSLNLRSNQKLGEADEPYAILNCEALHTVIGPQVWIITMNQN